MAAYALYFKLAHLVGIMCLFIGIGGYIAMSSTTDAGTRKLFGMLHGIGMVLILLAGFGHLGALKMGVPTWAILKTVLWLALGAYPVLAKRRILSDGVLVGIALILGTVLAWLGLFKAIA
jgi:hypothetical protein